MHMLFNALAERLVYSEYSRSFPLSGLLALVALLKRTSFLVRAAKVVVVLDLVNSNDPVLTGKCLLERVQLRAGSRQTRATDAVSGLASWEQRVVVVVAHLVHEGVAHGRSSLVVDAVLAAGSEEVTLLDLVGPNAYSEC